MRRIACCGLLLAVVGGCGFGRCNRAEPGFRVEWIQPPVLHTSNQTILDSSGTSFAPRALGSVPVAGPEMLPQSPPVLFQQPGQTYSLPPRYMPPATPSYGPPMPYAAPPVECYTPDEIAALLEMIRRGRPAPQQAGTLPPPHCRKMPKVPDEE